MSAEVSNKYPKGIPYIIGNELAERFSYYGMKGILVVFMTQYLMSSGELSTMNENEATKWYHVFSMANYFFPIVGAIISDVLWGKYKTIILLSIVYVLGHVALAIDESRLGLSIGLTLIAIGAGGIKPCVSAHVGDQFEDKNKHLIEKMFGYFYFSINLGAAVSTLLTPILLEKYGPHLAFGVPGFLMLLATIVFYMGRKVFIAIPPVGWTAYKKDIFSKKGKKAMINLSIMFVFIAVFWSLFDQTGSSWVLQAEKMDKWVNLGFVKFELLASQIQAINPLLIMIFIPLFTSVLYPFVNKFFHLTSLRKIIIGMFLAGVSFAILAVAESLILAGATPSILWQFWAYVILTAGEVMVSITGLEFSYTQAPNSMKSIVMGLWFLSVSLGNGITALVNQFIVNPDGTYKLDNTEYFWFFAILMFATAVLFVFVAMRYKEENYIQTRDALPNPLLTEN
ncbi:MAG: POT family MFS transporter [Ignavibacteria bacterium]|jgi:POT family proton-dependent oligopeptide transporter|nr:POT family MFS transporter [Ignavibacteria bacterium]